MIKCCLSLSLLLRKVEVKERTSTQNKDEEAKAGDNVDDLPTHTSYSGSYFFLFFEIERPCTNTIYSSTQYIQYTVYTNYVAWNNRCEMSDCNSDSLVIPK
mmetsp:Transcript_52656/g.58872  ORF Transcript_52656/g.58872 Transcript_52656/m.58872 type:complete len:101 (-) Transcript_52656:255-557(-)